MGKLHLMISIIAWTLAPSALALDFDREIAKQEVVRIDLQKSAEPEIQVAKNDEDKTPKDSFQVTLVPEKKRK